MPTPANVVIDIALLYSKIAFPARGFKGMREKHAVMRVSFKPMLPV